MNRAATHEVHTDRGVRVLQHNVILSEVLRAPGPTHSMADMLAATTKLMAPATSTVALLGFAAGGMLAPLRAMSAHHHVHAVDISDVSFGLFRRLCRKWSGKVTIELAEADAWLRTNRTRYDIILEDLSISDDNDVHKPEATWTVLPRLIKSRLNRNGIAVFNLLKPRRMNWDTGLRMITTPYGCARVISFDLYENRFVIAARELPTARQLSRSIRHHLREIRSDLADAIRVSTLS